MHLLIMRGLVISVMIKTVGKVNIIQPSLSLAHSVSTYISRPSIKPCLLFPILLGTGYDD